MKKIENEIILTGETVLIDIQKSFTEFFPFLKIQFLRRGTSESSRNSFLDLNTFVKNLIIINKNIIINLDKNRTVSEVCNDFENVLSVHVEVSRKSGNVWNVISVTDGWTLENQNSAGEYISSLMSGTAKDV